MNLTHMSLKEARNILARGEISPLTYTLEMLKQVNSLACLNSYISICEDRAMEMAKVSTEYLASRSPRPLEGILIAVKDLFCTKGVRTTSASKILENFIPTYESTVTQKLWDNGCIMVGKTNMDEFAMGSSNQTSFFGSVLNPWDHTKVPGGSSGGSAAAVAAGLCHAALGSDTGGSVRQPASFCGVVGVKPSYGRCSRYGMIAYSSSFDQAGVLARSVDDACIVLDKIMGKCTKDSTTENAVVPNLESVMPLVRGKRIGYIPSHITFAADEVQQSFYKALDVLRNAGAIITEIPPNELSTAQNALAQWMGVYYIMTPVEAFSNLSRYDGIRYGCYLKGKDLDDSYRQTRDQFGDEVKRRIMLGAQILSTEHKDAIHRSALVAQIEIKAKFRQIFTKVDAVISPTSPNTAFDLGAPKSDVDMYAEDAFTIIANLLGAPAISIPSELSGTGLPIGIQIMSAPFEEVKMIEVAKFLEAEFKFKQLHEVKKI